MSDRPAPVWRTPGGEPVSCAEKLKVMEQNMAEIRQTCQDALDDAVLMGCDEAQVRRFLHGLIDSLESPYRPAE